MKHLKLYEDMKILKDEFPYISEFINKPKIGDYIIFNDSTNIYRITNKIKNYKGQYTNRLEIEYIPTGIKYVLTENKNKIVFFSSNIEDCEDYLTAIKYNL